MGWGSNGNGAKEVKKPTIQLLYVPLRGRAEFRKGIIDEAVDGRLLVTCNGKGYEVPEEAVFTHRVNSMPPAKRTAVVLEGQSEAVMLRMEDRRILYTDEAMAKVMDSRIARLIWEATAGVSWREVVGIAAAGLALGALIMGYLAWDNTEAIRNALAHHINPGA